MKTNTKKFLKLIEKVNNYINDANEKADLKRFAKNLYQAGFAVGDPIEIKITNRHLKPLDLKAIENENNKVFFITAVRKSYKELEKVFFYNYEYDGGRIAEKNDFKFTSYSYSTNAENRAKAIFTILIYQNYKYIAEQKKKHESRAEKNTALESDESRLILSKEKINKNFYCWRYDETKTIYRDTLTKENIYNFVIRSGSFYSSRENKIEVDKSGYILTYKRNDLKQRAQQLKEKKARERFETSQRDYYIKEFSKAVKSIENSTINAYKKAVATGNLQNIVLLNNLYNDKIKDHLKELKRFIIKLNKKEFSSGWMRSGVLEFEKDLKQLDSKNKNYFKNILNEYNIYINFKNLYNFVEKTENEKGYNCFDELLKQKNYNYKWSCCINCYNENKHIIENNKIYFCGYDAVIKNYFDFMEV